MDPTAAFLSSLQALASSAVSLVRPFKYQARLIKYPARRCPAQSASLPTPWRGAVGRASDPPDCEASLHAQMVTAMRSRSPGRDKGEDDGKKDSARRHDRRVERLVEVEYTRS